MITALGNENGQFVTQTKHTIKYVLCLKVFYVMSKNPAPALHGNMACVSQR
jgi:hypothetical protein